MSVSGQWGDTTGTLVTRSRPAKCVGPSSSTAYRVALPQTSGLRSRFTSYPLGNFVFLQSIKHVLAARGFLQDFLNPLCSRAWTAPRFRRSVVRIDSVKKDATSEEKGNSGSSKTVPEQKTVIP